MSLELKITEFFDCADPFTYSHSIAEGGPHAGRNTWQAAKDADFQLLTTDDAREEFRQHIKDFGAWDDAQIAAYTDNELNALCIQLVSGDIREAGLDASEPDWAAYEACAAEGSCAGNLFKGDDGEIYYTIGG
jgi:hypothetical protein